MTDSELNELQKLCDAATPGPWSNQPKWSQEFYAYTCYAWESSVTSGKDFEDPIFDQPRLDAKFIAAARTALPELIDECRKLRAEIMELKK